MKIPTKPIGLFFLVSFLFIACEQEGDSLTLDDLYAVGEDSRPLFKASLNGRAFSSETARGAKVGNQMVITGINEDGQISFNMTDVTPGTYLGTDGINNQINYVDHYGTLYLSNREDEKSDSRIVITFFDEEESKITGSFSALLYDSNYKRDIYLTNGVFNGLFVEIPFFGKMSASIGNGSFDSEQCVYTNSEIGGIVIDNIIASSKDDTTRISFQIEEKIQLKTYNIEDANISANYNSNVFSFDTFQHQYEAENGSLTITSIDQNKKKLKGTFSFIARNQNGETIELKSGEFSALIS